MKIGKFLGKIFVVLFFLAVFLIVVLVGVAIQVYAAEIFRESPIVLLIVAALLYIKSQWERRTKQTIEAKERVDAMNSDVFLIILLALIEGYFTNFRSIQFYEIWAFSWFELLIGASTTVVIKSYLFFGETALVPNTRAISKKIAKAMAK
jgi:hypothetical protein